jgi:structural maintenance of chromosome 2
MYIQEIIIDGFKSYAQKTVVSGFDPQFNAITGLNGSGKSNILDSICFVLGISNLSQVICNTLIIFSVCLFNVINVIKVRVGNLQELVYKQGQAGVTKATVTVVFNNNDPANSPVGYESHKQITVTRQVATIFNLIYILFSKFLTIKLIIFRWFLAARINI